MVKKEPRKISVQVQGDLQVQDRIVQKSHTICHCLNENGLDVRRPRKTPHKKARLDFAKVHVDNQMKQINQIRLGVTILKIHHFTCQHGVVLGYHHQMEPPL